MGRRQRQNEPKSGGNRQAKIAARAAEREEQSVEPRPFAGFAGECDMVAMREFVPSATTRLTTPGQGRDITLATVLPGAIAGLVRDEELGGEALVGLQVQVHGQDPAADLAYAVDWASRAGGGETLNASHPSESTPALADVMIADAPMEIVVHEDFSWWLAEGVQVAPEIAQAVKNANEVMMPSARVAADGIEAAWWVDAGEKAHVRWVRPEDEDALFEALARVHAAGGLHLGDGSRFAGSFRTHGLLVPVFDLDPEMHHQEWAPGLLELDARLSEALAQDSPLSSDERASRAGLRSRQVTLR
ncbi:DUF5926 family protein [Rhodococcus sp. IEGM 1408]|uniref:DUF5926 family protein n=1 Tax=Rhodococcus sp. IEGM 1408 TaxID=3082220 RepID=UPI002954BEFD|nr:DUF5926 family protein [Rhodococcus sp. IEGM 1408]MDV8002069.1 DUF5926 family protein [Rhodococcus sp. IEGM 1408]